MLRTDRRKAWLLAALVVGSTGGPALARFPSVDPERGVMTMAPLLDAATPAVVNISVASRAPIQNPLMNDPLYRRFFGLPDRIPGRETLSAGSGVIVDAGEGLVVSNHHVVANAERITVTLKDGRQLAAQRLGSDPATDIALLRVPAGNLTRLGFGDSDELRVGDIVLAIGNPFGLGQTVTSGIISALGRSGVSDEVFEDFIQTDAAINPGNSGGALINSKGELIGINSAIITPGGGNVGIGFAVPSNMVRTVIAQLLRYGEVRRGRIGVVIQDLTPQLAMGSGLEAGQGAVVARVEPDSSAARAGLRPGDVVVEVEGSPVRNAADMRNRIGLAELDRTVSLAFLRDGRRRTAAVRIGGRR